MDRFWVVIVCARWVPQRANPLTSRVRVGSTLDIGYVFGKEKYSLPYKPQLKRERKYKQPKLLPPTRNYPKRKPQKHTSRHHF